MKKVLSYLTTAIVITLIVACFTVPDNKKLNDQIAASINDGSHFTIQENQFKVLGFVTLLTTNTVQYTGKATSVTLPNSTKQQTIQVATLKKVEVYIGLLGKFWKWN